LLTWENGLRESIAFLANRSLPTQKDRSFRKTSRKTIRVEEEADPQISTDYTDFDRINEVGPNHRLLSAIYSVRWVWKR